MLYDVIKIPLRLPEYTEINTTCPIFLHGDTDDCSVFGRVFQIPKLRKYKSIEIYGTRTIERTLLSEEDLDFTKKWWTCTDRMIPISFKIYNHTLKRCRICRYLDGIEEALGHTTWDGITNTIHKETLEAAAKLLYRQRQFKTVDAIQQVLHNPVEPVHYLINGNDRVNIKKLSRLQEYLICGINRLDLTAQYIDIFPKNCLPNLYFEDLGNQIAIQEKPTWSQFGNIRVPTFGATGCQHLVDSIPQLFTVDKTTVFNVEDIGKHESWDCHELLNELESMYYTDVSAYLEFDEQKVVKTNQVELGSRYLGYAEKDEDYLTSSAQIKSLLQQCWLNTIPTTGPGKLRLYKNWAEEVFLEVTTGNHTKRYYADLVMYNLGCLSLIEHD